MACRWEGRNLLRPRLHASSFGRLWPCVRSLPRSQHVVALPRSNVPRRGRRGYFARRADIGTRYQVCPKPLMARMPPSADTDDTDCVHAFIRHLPSVYIRDGEAASVASVVQSLVDGLARNAPAPPSARGVRLASGRLTRSGRRHGDTESFFETGLRAVSPTWSPLREGSFLPQNTQKRPSGDTEEAGEECVSHDPASSISSGCVLGGGWPPVG